jgi:hypothetical protein
MLKQVLKTVASVSAIAALFASCSLQPTQVKTIDQNSMTATVTPASSQPAKAIASNGFQPVHIIGNDNKIYKYAGNQTWTAYSTYPSGCTRIVLPFNPNGNNNYVYVLAGTNIYRHSITTITGAWTQIPTGTGGVLDIACGGKPNENNPNNQYLWKLGGAPNYNIYRYTGSAWTLVCGPPTAMYDANLQLWETPTNAKPSKLSVDYQGNAFCYLPIKPACCPGPTGPVGHIAWAATGVKDPNGILYTHDYNPYNTMTCSNYPNAALDIYGIQPNTISMATCDLCFYRVDGSTLYLFSIMMGDVRTTWSLVGDDGTTNLINVTGVTMSGATGGPWIIAENTHHNPTASGVMKSQLTSMTGDCSYGYYAYDNWVNP